MAAPADDPADLGIVGLRAAAPVTESSAVPASALARAAVRSPDAGTGRARSPIATTAAPAPPAAVRAPFGSPAPVHDLGFPQTWHVVAKSSSLVRPERCHQAVAVLCCAQVLSVSQPLAPPPLTMQPAPSAGSLPSTHLERTANLTGRWYGGSACSICGGLRPFRTGGDTPLVWSADCSVCRSYRSAGSRA